MRKVNDIGVLLRKGLTLPEIYRLLRIEKVVAEPIYRNIELMGGTTIPVMTKQIYILEDFDGNRYYLN